MSYCQGYYIRKIDLDEPGEIGRGSRAVQRRPSPALGDREDRNKSALN